MALPLTSFNQQSCIRKHSEVITISPFSRGPRSPHLMLPSWELQGSDPSPLLPVGVGPPDWGLAPGPYLTLWPFLVGWSVPSMSPVRAQPSRESEHRSRTELGIPSGGVPLHSSPGSSAPIHVAQGAGVVGISLGPPKMLQKPVLENPSSTLGELENSGLLHRRPRGVTTPSSEPQTKGLQSFYTRTGMIKWV